jgi:hypothetical protein
MKKTQTDLLIEALELLSPMPPDESPRLNAELLFKYGEIVDQIDELVRYSDIGRDLRFIEPLIRSFGYGHAHEAYWPVVHILEKYPLDNLRPALRMAIQTGERGSRMWVALMIGRQRNFEDVPLLIDALEDPEHRVRYNALIALSMIGDLSALSAMKSLLCDPIEEVRKMASESIESLLDQRYVVDE